MQETVATDGVSPMRWVELIEVMRRINDDWDA